MWVHAMDQYADVYELVQPKMAAYAALNTTLQQANAALTAKRAELARIGATVQELQRSRYTHTFTCDSLHNGYFHSRCSAGHLSIACMLLDSIRASALYCDADVTR
jgi:hypothetical protein